MGTSFRSDGALEGDFLKGLKRQGLRSLWLGAEPLAGGRGTARKARVGDRIYLVKRESRGGLASRFLPDRYLMRAPFEREWRITSYLAGRDLAPRILAREYVRSGPLLSVYSLYEYVPAAVSLADLMRLSPDDVSRVAFAGRGVGLVHRAGVVHADLNAGNVLLTGSGSVLLIDFRHSVHSETTLTAGRRRKNLDRLARSLHKIRLLGGLTWDTPPWNALADGYAEGWGSRDAWLPDWVLGSEEPPSRLRRLAW